MKVWGLFAAGVLAGMLQLPARAQSISAGTQLRVELDSTVGTRSSVTGQPVQATVLESLLENGRAIISTGSTLSGHVESVQPHRRREKVRGSMRLLFDSISLPDQRLIQCRAVIRTAGFPFSVNPDGNVSALRGFGLKPGRKLWLQLTDDLILNAPGPSTNAASGVGASEKDRSTPAKARVGEIHSVRMGELLVTADYVESESAGTHGLAHRVFTLHVQIHNVGKQFPCTRLAVYLVVEPFYQYAALPNGRKPSIPELLPGEITEGQYSFVMREGVVPKELLLEAHESGEERCAAHRDWGSAWHWRESATIPLEGLRNISNGPEPGA